MRMIQWRNGAVITPDQTKLPLEGGTPAHSSKFKI